jgi:methyl-accepting chemotaxis protein
MNKIKTRSMNNLKIGFRINLITSALMAFIILGMSGYNYIHRRNQIFAEIDKSMKTELDDFYRYLVQEISGNTQLAQMGLNFFREYFYGKGQVKIQKDEFIEYDAENQETKERKTIKVPAWYIDHELLQNNNHFVDYVLEHKVNTATIFQRIPEGFLRISTSIIEKDGSRAIGTFIPNNSPVAQSILSGNDFTGRAFVVNGWYLTSYAPIYVDSKIVGMLSVGQAEKDLSKLKTIFYSKTFFGQAFPYLSSTDGTLLVHPTEEGNSVAKEESFQKIVSSKEESGKLKYSYKGVNKIQYFHKVKEIDAVLAVVVFEEDVYSSIRNMLYLIIVITLIGIGLFIVVNTYFSRSITNGLKKGVVFAQKLSEGDLSSKIDLHQKDEVGELALSLNTMSEKLQEIVGGITTSADSIASASVQMSSTSEELSQGASEQASTVEEVSSTMEEITSIIESSAESAKVTEQVFIATQQSIEKIIIDAVSAIDANKVITSKIQVVSDIAFQTNILALNAAVEAARAGQHGLGFAVVADEVRRLADRSKDAAHEITEISKHSLERSESSSRNLSSLLPEIKKTTSMVKDILISSEQQRSGAMQVNDSLQELNQVAQQNASASEELAAGAEELTAQAETLTDLISFFKIK